VSLGNALDDRQAEADAGMAARTRAVPRWNRSVSVETSYGLSFSPVFSMVRTTDLGQTGKVNRLISSTRSLSSSHRNRAPLPCLVESRPTPSGVTIQVYRSTGRPQYETASPDRNDRI
jgi:hypothetical protein